MPHGPYHSPYEYRRKINRRDGQRVSDDNMFAVPWITGKLSTWHLAVCLHKQGYDS
jgi:hypothetical protein